MHPWYRGMVASAALLVGLAAAVSTVAGCSAPSRGVRALASAGASGATTSAATTSPKTAYKLLRPAPTGPQIAAALQAARLRLPAAQRQGLHVGTPVVLYRLTGDNVLPTDPWDLVSSEPFTYVYPVEHGGVSVAAIEFEPGRPPRHDSPWLAEILPRTESTSTEPLAYPPFQRALSVLAQRLGRKFEYRAVAQAPWGVVIGRSARGEAVVFVSASRFAGGLFPWAYPFATPTGHSIAEFTAYSGDAARQRLLQAWSGSFASAASTMPDASDIARGLAETRSRLPAAQRDGLSVGSPIPLRYITHADVLPVDPWDMYTTEPFALQYPVHRAGSYVAGFQLQAGTRSVKHRWSVTVRDIGLAPGRLDVAQYLCFARALAVLRTSLGRRFDYRASPAGSWFTVMGRSGKREAVVFVSVDRFGFIGFRQTPVGPPIKDFAAYSGAAARVRLQEAWSSWLGPVQ